MSFDRRDFLRVGATGVAGTVLTLEKAFSQDTQQGNESTERGNNQPRRKAQFEGGTGSLHLHLKVDSKVESGILDLQADNFTRGGDAGAIATGTFTRSKDDQIILYRSYFCVAGAEQVYCRLVDNGHKTSLVIANTSDTDVVSLTLWQESALPDNFRISKRRFLDAAQKTRERPDPEAYVLDDKGSAFKPDGQRKPPNISMEELINGVDDDRDYLAFVRGKRLSRQHAVHAVFACFFYTRVFDAILGSIWEGPEF